MQHYSAPTRLLDWSGSPWVALYFACKDLYNTDAKVWLCDVTKMSRIGSNNISLEIEKILEFATDEEKKEVNSMSHSEKFAELMFSDKTSEIIDLLNHSVSDERIESQQAKFTISTNPQIAQEYYLKENGLISEYIIPKELKVELMRLLITMNISAKTLFPGLDGLGRFIDETTNNVILA